MEPDSESEILAGGMMNAPRRIGHAVHRLRTPATETIHRLLSHVRARGVDWVPRPLGLSATHEQLSYLQGDVPHDMPGWIWEESVLCQVAHRMRQWHDATVDFCQPQAEWALETNTDHEVVCHNDFAPYNCVFQEGTMVGLIDFDLCAPGSRLWDMAYAAYRYVPAMPPDADPRHGERSPFPVGEIRRRIELFLECYSMGDPAFRFPSQDLLGTMSRRLEAIASWTRRFGQETSNAALERNALMYERHAVWIGGLLEARG